MSTQTAEAPGRFRAWVDDAFKARLAITRVLPRGGWRVVAASLVTNIFLGLLPVMFIVATSIMLGRVPAAVEAGLGSEAWDQLVIAFAFAAGTFVAQQVLAQIQVALGELIHRRVDGYVTDRLIVASVSSPGVGPLEDQSLLDYLDQSTWAIEHGFRTPGGACSGVLALVARYTQLAGMVVVAAIAFAWWAGLALLVLTMAFRYGQRGGIRKYSAIWYRNARERREGWYYRGVGIEPPAAKEVRVFGLIDWLRGRYRRIYFGWLKPVWRERRRIYLGPYLVYTAFGLIISAMVFIGLGRATAQGDLGLTELAFTFQAAIAAIRLGEHYPEADTHTEFGMYSWRHLVKFEAGVARHAAEVTPLEPAADPAGLPQKSLRFEQVDFHYPGSDRLVIDGLDLEIEAGRATAIVGLNGAGKTTLVKLLARFYEPTEGRVTADDIDLRRFDLPRWRSRIGVVFQDYNHYELSAAENIAFGAIHRAGDREAIRRAAERAGILETLEELPGGMDTPLSRQYEGGVDLSGGQWQRIAIARALFAIDGGSSILVLDEPTANLDVRAEAAFFDQFVEMTRGVTTILISHRFSSVRRADRIVVLQGGRVVEDGSHEELLAADGRYARLFRLQAERFARGEELTEEEEEEVRR
jgi:ATP-binding cassette subfamily B protein